MLLVTMDVENFAQIGAQHIDYSKIYPGCIIQGRNGIGKSNLFVHAPLYALYGRVPYGKIGQWVKEGERTMQISLQVRLGENLRYIIRRYGEKSHLEYYNFSNGGVVQLHKEASIKELQGIIASEIGMSYETALHVMFSSQADTDRFFRARPAERKQILVSMLNLTVWDELQKQSKTASDEVQRELIQAHALFDEIENKIVDPRSLEVQVENLEARQKTVNVQLEAVQTGLGSWTVRNAQITSCVGFVEKVQQQRDAMARKISPIRNVGEIAEEKDGIIEMKLGQEQVIERETEALKDSESWLEGYRKRDATEEKKILLSVPCNVSIDPYKECRFLVNAWEKVERWTAYKEEFTLDEEQLVRMIELGKELIESARKASTDYQMAIGVLERLIIDQDNMQGYIEALQNAQKLLNEENEKLDRLIEDFKPEMGEALEQEKDSLSTHRDTVMVAVQDAKRDLEENVERREQYNKLMSQMAKVTNEVIDYDTLSFAYKSIPMFLLTRAVPWLETKMNEVLLKLFPGVTVEFSLFKEKGDGSTGESLEIAIITAATTHPYEMKSGGERFKIALAFRIALAELMNVKCIVIDEGFGSQDTENISIMKAHLRECVQFCNCLVITHLEEMRDTFDIVFTLGENGSGIEKVSQMVYNEGEL